MSGEGFGSGKTWIDEAAIGSGASACLVSGDDSEGWEEISLAGWLGCGLLVIVTKLCKKIAKVVAESAVGKVSVRMLLTCSIILNHLEASSTTTH
jgi:hypothetical protein